MPHSGEMNLEQLSDIFNSVSFEDQGVEKMTCGDLARVILWYLSNYNIPALLMHPCLASESTSISSLAVRIEATHYLVRCYTVWYDKPILY